MPKLQNISSNLTSNFPKRIAFCITELDPGGAERALVQIVTRLDRAKWEPKVYCLGTEGEMAAPLREQGIQVKCFGAKSGKVFGRAGALQAVKWLRNELKEFQPTLLQGFLFHANIVGRLAGSQAKVPVILSGHRVAEKEKLWHLWVDWLTKNKVDQHVAVSTSVARYITTHLRLRDEECCVIPNGVDPNLRSIEPLSDAELMKLGVPSGAKLILAVGRLHPQKGLLDLLEAFALLKDVSSDSHLIIVGEGPQRSELVQKIEFLGLEKRVHLTGFRRDVHAIMRRADLFVLSSHWEGLPNVLLEAMVLGIPVVATDVEGVSMMIKSGQEGLIVPVQQPVQLSQAMLKVLTDHNLSKLMASKAQLVVAEQFSWDKMASKYSQLFEVLLVKVPK